MTTCDTIICTDSDDLLCPNYHQVLGYPLRVDGKKLHYVCPQCEPSEQVHTEIISNISDSRVLEMYRYFCKRKQRQNIASSSLDILETVEKEITSRELSHPNTELTVMRTIPENVFIVLYSEYPEIKSLVENNVETDDDEFFTVPLTTKEEQLVDNLYRN